MKISVIGSNQLSIYRALYLASKKHTVNFYCHSQTRQLIDLLKNKSCLFNNLWNQHSNFISFQDSVDTILSTDIAFLHYTELEANYYNNSDVVRTAPIKEVCNLLEELHKKLKEVGASPFTIVSSVDLGITSNIVMQASAASTISWLYMPMMLSPECSYSEYRMYVEGTLNIGYYPSINDTFIDSEDEENEYAMTEASFDNLYDTNSNSLQKLNSLFRSVNGISYKEAEIYKKAYDIMYVSKLKMLQLISKLSSEFDVPCIDILREVNKNTHIRSLNLPAYTNVPMEMCNGIRPANLNLNGKDCQIAADFDSVTVREVNDFLHSALHMPEVGARVVGSIEDIDFLKDRTDVRVLVVGMRSYSGSLSYRGSLGYCICKMLKDEDISNVQSISVYDRNIDVTKIPELEGITNANQGLHVSIKEADVIFICNNDYPISTMSWYDMKNKKVIYDMAYSIDNTSEIQKHSNLMLVQLSNF